MAGTLWPCRTRGATALATPGSLWARSLSNRKHPREPSVCPHRPLAQGYHRHTTHPTEAAGKSVKRTEPGDLRLGGRLLRQSHVLHAELAEVRRVMAGHVCASWIQPGTMGEELAACAAGETEARSGASVQGCEWGRARSSLDRLALRAEWPSLGTAKPHQPWCPPSPPLIQGVSV